MPRQDEMISHLTMMDSWYQPTERERIAAAAAEMYDWHCERYDRTVCTGEIVNGSIRPVTMEERGLIVKNAREFRKMLLIEYGLAPREFHDALRHLHGDRR